MNTDNLKILADYLAKLPKDYDRFDMGSFCSRLTDGGSRIEIDINEDISCGTSMCAVGHGINAGIEREPGEHEWVDYAQRAFGDHWWNRNMQWCFSGLWDIHYPDIEHAIQRLRYAARYGGAPTNFRSIDASEEYNFADFGQVPT